MRIEPTVPSHHPYQTSNATATHGRVAPWDLTAQQREIETLERLRRVESLLHRIVTHLEIPPTPSV